jgi:hypothetical protein
MRRTVLLIAVLLLCTSRGAAQDRIRGFFEWGEYDSLLIAIPAYCSGAMGAVDSTLLCDYIGYLGVAFFAKGDIADARNAFRQAILCRSTIALDSQYVTPEMLNLFADARKEIEAERIRQRREDSLRAQAEMQRKIQEQERLVAEQRFAQRKALDRVFRNAAWISGTLLTLTVASSGAAVYEYTAGREYDREFKSAAASGDLREYERLRDLLRRQNRNIIGFSTAAVLSGCLASYYGVRCVVFYRARAAITLMNGSYGITLALDL